MIFLSWIKNKKKDGIDRIKDTRTDMEKRQDLYRNRLGLISGRIRKGE